MAKQSFWEKVGIVLKALFHKQTPLSVKMMLLGGLLYGILPIDLVPDLVPLLGIADDAVVILSVIFVFLHATKKLREELAK